MICCIGLNRHEVAAHDSNVMVVNGKNKCRIRRGVDQTQKIFVALRVVVGRLEKAGGVSLPSQRLCCIFDHSFRCLRSCLAHGEKDALH